MSRVGKIYIGLLIAMALLPAGCASTVQPPEKILPPEKIIESLYAPYVSYEVEHGESSWAKAAVYSKSFKAAIDRGLEFSLLLNEPVIDYDPIVGAQDVSIMNLRIAVDRPASSGKAHVIARFQNVDRETTVGYEMLLEGGAWKIDGIRSGDHDLRQSIVDALKTIGDPEAMKAPVEAIYAHYGAGENVEPMNLWAPLTNDLRDKLETATSKSVILGFDPVCGGPPCVPSNVKLEAVSSGVIARFRVGKQNRIAVFDVVGDGEEWAIDDIHNPGKPTWDLVQKLAAAGIH